MAARQSASPHRRRRRRPARAVAGSGSVRRPPASLFVNIAALTCAVAAATASALSFGGGCLRTPRATSAPSSSAFAFAFAFASDRRRRGPSLSRLLAAPAYGRGTEVWPPTNEIPVRLEDSFPGGTLPASAAAALNRVRPPPAAAADASGGGSDAAAAAPSEDLAPPAPSDSLKRRRRPSVRAAVKKILLGAAASERTATSGGVSPSVSEAFWDAPVDKSPAVVALALLLAGLVRPTDAILVASFTGYAAILGIVGSSSINTVQVDIAAGGALSSGGTRPAMPSLPPRGHVPSLVSNPLGVVATNSATYRSWLRAGAGLGLVGPLVAVLWYAFGPAGTRSMEAARCAARPVFLLCCQAVSEAASRRLLAPLPLRILVPIAYSAMRLGPLWDWTLAPVPLGIAGRVLAATNLVYWSANLFGFLIPVAAVRYMRAHFFCVEAAEVTLREGGEGAAGLLP